MTIGRDSSLREVAFEVCTALDAAGVQAVLSGGGAATVHAPRAIQSFDLDFILTFRPPENEAARALEVLGYRREGVEYRHLSSPFLLEFPRGPLAVGGDLIEDWETLRTADQLLHLLTPTDSCRDRLSAFYHFADRSSLKQACDVRAAAPDRVDLEVIREWSDREGRGEAFEEFLRLVETGGIDPW